MSSGLPFAIDRVTPLPGSTVAGPEPHRPGWDRRVRRAGRHTPHSERSTGHRAVTYGAACAGFGHGAGPLPRVAWRQATMAWPVRAEPGRCDGASHPPGPVTLEPAMPIYMQVDGIKGITMKPYAGAAALVTEVRKVHPRGVDHDPDRTGRSSPASRFVKDQAGHHRDPDRLVAARRAEARSRWIFDVQLLRGAAKQPGRGEHPDGRRKRAAAGWTKLPLGVTFKEVEILF